MCSLPKTRLKAICVLAFAAVMPSPLLLQAAAEAAELDEWEERLNEAVGQKLLTDAAEAGVDSSELEKVEKDAVKQKLQTDATEACFDSSEWEELLNDAVKQKLKTDADEEKVEKEDVDVQEQLKMLKRKLDKRSSRVEEKPKRKLFGQEKLDKRRSRAEKKPDAPFSAEESATLLRTLLPTATSSRSGGKRDDDVSARPPRGSVATDSCVKARTQKLDKVEREEPENIRESIGRLFEGLSVSDWRVHRTLGQCIFLKARVDLADIVDDEIHSATWQVARR